MDRPERRKAPGPPSQQATRNPEPGTSVRQEAGAASLPELVDAIPGLVQAARALDRAGLPSGPAWRAAAASVRTYCSFA